MYQRKNSSGNLLKGILIGVLCLVLIVGVVLCVRGPKAPGSEPQDAQLSAAPTEPSEADVPQQETEPTKPASVPQETTPAQTEPQNAPTQPKPAVPEATRPQSGQSNPTEPQPTAPAPTQPQPTDPVPTAPAPTEPTPTEPAPTEPEPTEPAPTEPEPTEPEKEIFQVLGQVSAENNVVTQDASFGQDGISAQVPSGTVLDSGTTELVLTIEKKENSDSGITTEAGQSLQPLDVHIAGVSPENTAPITICLGKILPNGMNIGNVGLYHVENGSANPMAQVLTAAELDSHNEFYYDPATGDITVAMASFSEIAVVSEPSKWEGKYDYTWYTKDATEYTIANADQLAAFGRIVSGYEVPADVELPTDEDGNRYDSFDGKTIKLTSDVDLADKESENNSSLIFYPIGYYYIADQNGDENTNDPYSTVYSFEGCFDGQGHTISNFYQNTWEMRGDDPYYDKSQNHYYNDAMGLFGYVVDGKIENLTVDNFSSDGEYTPTGVIAAYAVNSEFKNIAITNCNPRVYNTGNGGIVGIAGNSSDTNEQKLTFTNITIDNSNKISALWGSWDVACGGLMGMFRGYSEVTMTNCHVAAQIDVFNDVCGNYQYYWYRYSGMMIGSLRGRNKTDEAGYTVPDMTGITAKDCTVHFGDWNDYYYCELVANSLASYTHDHQFSRLDLIGSLDEIKSGETWLKTGNFLLIEGDTKTCYHIVKDADGTLRQHSHDDYNNDGEKDYETVNGEQVFVEDKRIVYLPFNQLFQGDGWGVKHVPIYDDGTPNPFNGVTILDRDVADSVTKFVSVASSSYATGDTVTIGELFTQAANLEVGIDTDNVQVFVSPVGETSTASGIYTPNTTDWTQGTLTFSGAGAATISITDYNYCKTTTINVTITEQEPAEKFVTKFTGDFLYRVGNDPTTPVKLSSLFETKDGAEIGNVTVTVDSITNGVSGTYTPNATWTNGTIQFSGTGVVKLTITDNNYCIPTELYLEVVEAKNATTATSATSNNVVLLNDTSGSFSVSGGHTFYGNGFKVTNSGNGAYSKASRTVGYVTVSDGGILENVQIVCDVFPKSYLYTAEMEADSNGRYPYVMSAVTITDDSTISNCYIYGARNNIYIGNGNVTIKDTVTECGSLSNIHIMSSDNYTVTLDGLTTIQYQTTSKYDNSAVVLGFGVVVGDNDSASNAKINLVGDLKQYNWVTDADKSVSNTYAKTAITSALKEAAYQHTINGTTAVNMGIAYLNAQPATHTDARINKDTIPYLLNSISMGGKTGQVLSISGNNTISESFRYNATSDGVIPYVASTNGLYVPQFAFDDDLGGQYIANTTDCDEFCYTEGDSVKVMFISGETKVLDLAALVNIAKYTGQDLNLVITCKDENGNSVTVTDNKITLSTTNEYTITYSVTDTLFYDQDGKQIPDTKNYSWDVTLSVSLKDNSVPDARFDFVTGNQKMGYYKPTIGDVKQYIPFLAGLRIYDYVGQNEYLRFDGDNDFNKVASVTITEYVSNEAYIEVKLTDGGVINTKFLARADSGGGSTYTGKIKTSNNVIYFVTDSGTSNKEATTTAAYWYVDYYKFTGNNGVAIQSPQQTFNSKGSSASTPSGNFGTTIKYTVTYNANGGDCGQSVGYATSASAAVTLPTPTRRGNIFVGWYTAASGGTRVGGAGDAYTPAANITLYAQWGAPCTVTYDANGGSCGTTSERFDGKTLILPEATRDGYTFLGWYTAPEDGERVGPAGMSYNPNADITLYAQWQIPITVTYNANGGICGTTSELYDGDLTLPTPTLEGYSCTGWYTAATGGTKVGAAGASYTPTENITLYAQWQINSYTITVTTSNATVKVNGTAVSNNGTVSVQYGAQVTVAVTYSESDSQSTTIKGTDGTTYTSPFTMPAQDVTINATSSGCVTGDTLITLADGSQVRVDALTGDEELLVWNLETGSYDTAPIVFVDSDAQAEYEVVNLHFSDGSEVGVIYEHGFFDYDLGKYVYLDAGNAESYIGHTFVTQGDIASNTWNTATLTDVVIETKVTTAYSPVTFSHLCYYTDGVLSMPGGIEGLFNIFQVDTATMAYDAEKKAQDIETYGLYTYEDFADVIPEDAFYAFNGAYLKVAIGKGMLTWEDIEYLAQRYVPLM